MEIQPPRDNGLNRRGRAPARKKLLGSWPAGRRTIRAVRTGEVQTMGERPERLVDQPGCRPDRKRCRLLRFWESRSWSHCRGVR